MPHFNEVDECAGLDGLVTYRLWRELGFAPENTLHDLRWGQHYRGNGLNDYVWVFLISGAAPPAHFTGGYEGREQRTPAADVFPAGRRHDQGHLQTGPHRLEPGVCHGRQTALRHWAWRRSSSCRPKKPNAAGARRRRNGRSCTPS